MSFPKKSVLQERGLKKHGHGQHCKPQSHTPCVAQPKTAPVSQMKKPPTAPPAYRPQPVPKVLQRKATTPQQPQAATAAHTRSAPTVYRPQPTPKVLQKKTAPVQQARAAQAPAAPPAYRPQPAPKVLQTKSRFGAAEPPAVKVKSVPGSAGRRTTAQGAVQAKIVFGARNGAHKSTPALRPQPQAGAARGASQSCIQRMINWGHNNQGELVITDVYFDRPTGTSNSGAHTTAISVFQQTAMEAVWGKTYADAKKGFLVIFQALLQLPGSSMSILGDVEMACAMIRTGNGLANETIQANWTSNLEALAKLYILTREKLEHTHHEKGMGGKGNSGEGTALNNLDSLLSNANYSWKAVDKGKAIEYMIKLLDLRNVPSTIGYEELGGLLVQHIGQLNQTYPGLIGSGLDLAFLNGVCETLKVPNLTRMYVMQFYESWQQMALMK